MTEKIIPDGYKMVAVKGLDELVYWLERCKDKGHLENCADLIEPFEAFEYRNVSEEAVIAAHEAKAAPAVPQGEPLPIKEQQKEWAEYINRCDSYDPPDRRHAFLAGLARGRVLALTATSHHVVPQGGPVGWYWEGYHEWYGGEAFWLVQLTEEPPNPSIEHRNVKPLVFWSPTAAPSGPVTLTEDEIDANTVWFDPDPHDNVHCDVHATVNKCIAALREKEAKATP